MSAEILDPIRQWRERTGRVSDMPAAAPAEDGGADDDATQAYRPWSRLHSDAAERSLELRIKRVPGLDENSETFAMRWLLNANLRVSQQFGDILTLRFPDCVVSVRGRQLKVLARSLQGEGVMIVREFDHTRSHWREPGPGEPCVTGIACQWKRGEDMAG